MEDITKIRIERHQAYVKRQWEYFLAFLLLQGLLLNAVKDLINIHTGLFIMIATSSILTVIVFNHLVFWVKIRIHRNAKMINRDLKEEFIELPKIFEFQGITLWLSISMLSYMGCWLVAIYEVIGKEYTIILFIIIVLLLVLSFRAGRILFNRN